MELTVVKTPKDIQFKDTLNLREIGATLNAEFKENEFWTDVCSNILKTNTSTLFLYDRFEYALGRAYGHDRYKIALNPLMIVCYHPSCIIKKSPVIKLRHMFDINYYIMHLMNHTDEIGKAMLLRFSAVAENNFISITSLNQISRSPYCLNPSLVIPSDGVSCIEKYGISRKLNVNYICHWKSRF